jgi:penicillin amidase
MKILNVFIALIFTGLWVFILNRPIVTKSSTIPALGSFLSPWHGFWHNESVDDVHFGNIQARGLSVNASVVWDNRLVPHLFAQNDKDVFYVQGYTIASQRLWQMDMLARSAAGRLAEVIGGERLIERDRQQRRSGMLLGAENEVKGWQTDTAKYKILESYCKGINDYISTLKPRDLPIEYKLMRFAPEPWSILKTACIVKYMAQSLCSRESDLEATNTRKMLGDSLFNMLYPSYFAAQSPVIPVGTKWNFETVNVTDSSKNIFNEVSELYERSSELPPEGLGSNNWAISGMKSSTGHPILCNDPHLRLTLPSIWIENHLNTPEMNAYGVSVPGIPGILIGFNDSIAWGETNVGQDVADWYQITWTDQQRTKYMLDGKEINVKYRYEVIKVKDRAPVIDTIKLTCWGPVVTEKLNDPHQGLAYHWISHEIPSSFEMGVFLNLMKAKNYKDYYNALKDYSNPAQNFVFASKQGDVAITVNGKFPLKQKDQGRFVQDGSKSSNAWKGYIPSDQNPRIKNPERGFVSSANQNSTDPSYPYYYNGDFENYRGRVVNAILDSSHHIGIQEMKSMQNSTFSLKAKENLPIMIGLLDLKKLPDSLKNLVSRLQQWDFHFDANSEEAMVFNVWYRTMYKDIFDELYTSKDSSSLLYPKNIITSELLSKYPTHKIFDIIATPSIETASDIILNALVETMKDLSTNGMLHLTWSEYTKPRIQHMANLPGFSSPYLKAGGVADALCANNNGSGPSWRMIVSLNDSTSADVIFPGGQSGNPASKYYDNMINDWVNGNYQKAYFTKIRENIPALGAQIFIR